MASLQSAAPTVHTFQCRRHALTSSKSSVQYGSQRTACCLNTEHFPSIKERTAEMCRNDLLIACALCSPICSPQAAQGCTVTASHNCITPLLTECHRLSGRLRRKRRRRSMYRGVPRKETPGKKMTSDVILRADLLKMFTARQILE